MSALSIDFTDGELELLHRCAQAQGHSPCSVAHDLLVSALTVAVDEHEARIRAATERVINDNRELFERLADQ
jgi:hypothetical protein